MEELIGAFMTLGMLIFAVGLVGALFVWLYQELCDRFDDPWDGFGY